MKDMGVNTLRWYHNGFPQQKSNKRLLRDLYKTYGIRVAVADFLGAYTIATGASWEAGTDYRDIDQQNRMIESVKKMVEEHKDEEYVLLWILGNENNLVFTQTNAGQVPEVYAKFLNKVAKIIHEMDPNHPVAFINGDLSSLKFYGKFAPEIDIFGVNAYRGPTGFGDLWERVKRDYDKPVLITEYGFNMGVTEDGQVDYHRGCWKDIERNQAGGSGEGNSIGGMAFEWVDRWWTAGDPFNHAVIDFEQELDGHSSWNLENGAICTQGNGNHSPFLRQFRKVHHLYKEELWR